MEGEKKKHRVQEEERLQNDPRVEIEEGQLEFVPVELVGPVNVVDDLYLLKEGGVNRGDEAKHFPQGEDKNIVVNLYHCEDITYKTRYESLRRYHN